MILTKYYNISTSIEGGGSSSCPQSGVLCASGSSIKIITYPHQHWKLLKWIINGNDIHTNDNILEIDNIQENKNIIIVFVSINYRPKQPQIEEVILEENETKNTEGCIKQFASKISITIDTIREYFPKLKY